MLTELVDATAQSDWPRVRDLLYAHWQNHCPKLYTPNPDSPWELSIDEQAINSAIFRPLAAAYVQNIETATASLLPLNEEAGTSPADRQPGQICGHVFKCGEATYSCKECAQDATCVLCRNCFNKSIHKAHKYTMHTSGGVGYCDCKRDFHRTTPFSTKGLPQELHTRLYGLTKVLLQYATNVLCWPHADSYPAVAVSNSDFSPAYQCVLFNDETHTYDNVIRALEIAVTCNHNQAKMLATIVDREGRSTVMASTKSSCERARDAIVQRTQRDMSRRTEKQGPLVVKVYESTFVAHQSNALQIFAWLNQQIEHFPPLGRIIGEVLMHEEVLVDGEQPERPGGVFGQDGREKLAERFMYNDCKLWKAARSCFQQMLMKTVLMHLDLKHLLSRMFLFLYDHLYVEFCDDDHEHDVSIISLTVQFFTVTSLARRLIAEEKAMVHIFQTLINHARSTDNVHYPVDHFDFSKRQFTAKFKRAMHMIRDVYYLVGQVPKPDEWTEELRNGFVCGVEAFLGFLKFMQGMDAVKRQVGEHQTWEQEWETAFNIQLRQQELISLIIQWALSDPVVHKRVFMMALDACANKMPPKEEKETGETKTYVKVGEFETVIPVFDILHGSVSIHQPFYRFLAALFNGDRELLYYVQQSERPGSPTEEEHFILTTLKKLDVNLYEPPLRIFVLCSQTASGLWRRNGFSVVNQIHNYYSPLCRTEMYDRDLRLLQVGAAMTPPVRFLLHVLCRYSLDKWADENFDGTPRSNEFGQKAEWEENSKCLVSLAEDLMHTLILITGERWIPGVGECTQEEELHRELIHVLASGPMQFSAINKRLAYGSHYEKISIEHAVKKVADFRKPTPATAGTFHLKKEMLEYYTPFFYHYSKTDMSQAELYQEKSRPKCERKAKSQDWALAAGAPPKLIPFMRFFRPVKEILSTTLLVRLHRVILERTAKRSRFSSDRLLHRTLFLIGMGLHEQFDDQENFGFLAAAEQEYLLEALEALNGKPEAHPHGELLAWTIQKYKEVERAQKTDSSHEAPPEDVQMAEVEDVEEAKKKRAARAQAMRTAALQKMQKLQKNFTDSMRKEQEGTASDSTADPELAERRLGDEDEDIITKLSDVDGFPVCIGPGRVRAEKIVPRIVKCILCQEEEPLDEKARPFVCAAFVQRSHLFSQTARSREYDLDVHLVNAALSVGIDASTCSHTMHFECYHNLADSLFQRDRARNRQQMLYSQKMIDTDSGEYLCPLCKRLSNTAMPLVPAMQFLKIDGFSENRPKLHEEFDEWVERLGQIVNAPPVKAAFKSHSRKRSHSERAINEMVKQTVERDPLSPGKIESAMSSSVPSVSSMNIADADSNEEFDRVRDRLEQGAAQAAEAVRALQAIVAPEEAAPASPGSPEASTRVIPKREFGTMLSSLPNTVIGMILRVPQTVVAKFIKRIVPFEKYEESVRAFTKYIIKARYDAKDLGDQVQGVISAIAVWKSTAHVTRSIAMALKQEGKPLFGALNTRQRDCILALSRLSALLSCNLQPFGTIIAQMLKVLLSPPPEPCTSRNVSETAPMSPSAVSSPTGESTTPASIFMKLTGLTPTRKEGKEANFNLLHVDMLSLAIELMMCIGWTWHGEKQSFSHVTPMRGLVPDGSLDELYILRLVALAHCFQIIATFQDDDPMETEDGESPTAERVRGLWSLVHRDVPLLNVRGLTERLNTGVLDLLRPIALVYFSISMTPPPEALKDPSVDELEPLSRYLGLPTSLVELLDGDSTDRLFDMWSAAMPPEAQIGDLVRQPVSPRLLVDLPDDFSDLINVAAKFRCPSIPLEEMTASVPTMCMVCSEVLCSQSYCCQKHVEKEVLGACQYHMLHCTGNSGIFLRIRESQVVLLASKTRGCLKAAPYVDEFGETDVGFRRGNPLHLNREQYNKLRQLWIHQGLMEEVVNQFDLDHRNYGYDWVHF
ncbi:unnamed protein product, partial [Mesorhabditis spiculigera]